MITPYSEFLETFLKNGCYRTPERRLRSTPVKPGAWVSFRYFCCIMRMVSSCSAKHVFRLFDHDVWAKATWRSLSVPESLGTPVSVEGFEKRIANPGPAVYVCNHMSTLETMALPPILNPFGNISIILKKSLAEMPFVGAAIRRVGAIAVTRTNPREDLKIVLDEGLKRLESGMSVLIFPQGTRSDVFKTRKFSSLGAKLAEKANVPLIPIACSTNFLGRGKPGLLQDFGAVDTSCKLRFSCGDILSPSLGARQLNESSIAFIAGKLKEWGLPVEDGGGEK